MPLDIPYVDHNNKLKGMPLYWRDDQTGQMTGAVMAYYNACLGTKPGPTPEQLELVCDFCRYFINAPVWLSNPELDDETRAEIEELKVRALSLASVESVRRWISECMEVGLDPL